MRRYGNFTLPKSYEQLTTDTSVTTENPFKDQLPGELDSTVLNGLTFHFHREFQAGQFSPDVFNQFKPEEVETIKRKLFQFFSLEV